MYGQQFQYQTKRVEVTIKCAVSYLPFEARMDRVTFELFLLKTQPQKLLLINGPKKTSHLKDFCSRNNLAIELHHIPNSQYACKTDTAVK